MIIDIADDNVLLYQHLRKQAWLRYNPIPRCGIGFTMSMLMTDEEKKAAAIRTEKYENAPSVIHDLIFGENNESK